MYSKFNIESKVNCNQYGALLSGATGSLGLGGSGGGTGTTQAAPSATAGNITSGDITPTTSGIYAGGFNVNPTIDIAFPSAKTQKHGDINNPLEMFSGMNWVYIGLALMGMLFFFLIFRRT